MNRIVYIPFDHLNAEHGAMAHAKRESDVIVLVESHRMTHGRPWHRQRLQFLISSARHFAQELEAQGWTVRYVKSASTIEGIATVQEELSITAVMCAEPNSFEMCRQLSQFGVQFVDNDMFLTPKELFSQWAQTQSSFTMENFYRSQRRRLNVLMDGKDPLGGSWNYDAENRLPPPKDHDWGVPLSFVTDEIDVRVADELPDSAWGALSDKVWGTTRAEALAQMSHFFTHHFKDFGPYEDAMPAISWSGHHSLLSPYLNNGLLHASEVIEAALVRFAEGDIPLSSCEGFIRQIIGWREYINGMYWHLGVDYRNRNGLQVNRNLLPLFRNPEQTHMSCVKSVVTDVQHYGWTHHIPRLMVLSNLALIAGVSPQQFLDWMREVFIDAADWVMVPNVIGMATHADDGVLMTKPYAAGGAYISKMGQWCKSCVYDPKQRVGPTACPFTTLYWDFLDRNVEVFAKNHRMFQQFAGLKRLNNLDEVRVRADEVLRGLSDGTI